jgi:antitoxin-like ribbon-helix-helix protein
VNVREHSAKIGAYGSYYKDAVREYVLARINTEGWKALKVLAAEQETTLNALAIEAFNDLLKKHGKRQSVENPLLD